MVGESPLGPFHIYGTGEIMPTAPPYWFYASQPVSFHGGWFLLGTIRDEEGDRISDPRPVVADEGGFTWSSVGQTGSGGGVCQVF